MAETSRRLGQSNVELSRREQLADVAPTSAAVLEAAGTMCEWSDEVIEASARWLLALPAATLPGLLEDVGLRLKNALSVDQTNVWPEVGKTVADVRGAFLERLGSVVEERVRELRRDAELGIDDRAQDLTILEPAMDRLGRALGWETPTGIAPACPSATRASGTPTLPSKLDTTPACGTPDITGTTVTSPRLDRSSNSLTSVTAETATLVEASAVINAGAGDDSTASPDDSTRVSNEPIVIVNVRQADVEAATTANRSTGAQKTRVHGYLGGDPGDSFTITYNEYLLLQRLETSRSITTENDRSGEHSSLRRLKEKPPGKAICLSQKGMVWSCRPFRLQGLVQPRIESAADWHRDVERLRGEQRRDR